MASVSPGGNNPIRSGRWRQKRKWNNVRSLRLGDQLKLKCCFHLFLSERERQRERDSVSVGARQRERERETESEAGSRL